MSQSPLCYFRIDILLPSALTSITDKICKSFYTNVYHTILYLAILNININQSLFDISSEMFCLVE